MAKAKKESSGAKTSPVSKPRAFPTTNTLTQKPKTRSVFDAPDPIKPDTRAPVSPPKDRTPEKKKPEKKAPEKRVSPRQQMVDAQPKQSSISSVLGDVTHAMDIGAGTAVEVAKAIPGSVMAPHIVASNTGAVGSPDHSPIETVKPTTWAKSLGQDKEPEPTKPYHAPTDYPDMFAPDGSRTHLSPDKQAGKLKTLTKDEADHFNRNAIKHPLVASFLFAVQSDNKDNPIPKGLRDYTINVVKQMSPEQRTRSFAGVPNIQSDLLFPKDVRKKTIQPLIDKGLLPQNASDKEILDFFHTHDADGNSLVKEKGHENFFGKVVSDAGDIASGLAHAPLAIPALIGAAKHPEGWGEIMRTGADPYLGFAAHPFNSVKEHKMLSEHPLQTALLVAPGVGKVIGGAAEIGMIGRGAKALAKAKGTERVVHLPHYDRPALPEGMLHEIDARAQSQVDWANKMHEKRIAKLEPHDAEGIAASAAKRDAAIDQAGAQRETRLATITEHVGHIEPFNVHAGQYSRRAGRALGQGLKDKAIPALDSALRAVTGEESLSPFSGRVIKKAGKRAERQISAEGAHVLGGLINEAKGLSRGIGSARQSELLRTHGQGITNDALETYYGKRYEEVRKGRVKRQVASQALLAKKGMKDGLSKPITEDEQKWLKSVRAIAQHRTDLLKNINVHTGHPLPDESALYREYQPAIITAAAGDGPLAKLANEIIVARDAVMANEKVKVKFEKDSEEANVHRANENVYKTKLREFVAQHKVDTGTSVDMGTAPFRVPFEKPSPLNPFRGATAPGDVPANTNIGRLIKGTTGALFEEGGYVPQTAGAVAGDAVRAQRAANGVEFVQRITDTSPGGPGLVHEAIAGAPVPENFVLRSTKNLRAAPKLKTDVSGMTNDLATAQHANEIWKESHYEHKTVPSRAQPGDYVLVPKALDDMITKDLGRVNTPVGWANTIFRYRVLYSNPKWAVTNVAGNMLQSSLEGVGPFTYSHELLAGRRIPFTDKHLPGTKTPVAPGVVEHGFLGAHSLDAGGKGIIDRWNDIMHEPNWRKQMIKSDPLIFAAGTLTSGVKAAALTFENFSRKATYRKVARKEARRLDTTVKMTTKDVLAAMAKADSPAEYRAAANRAVDRVNAVLGDYNALPQVAKIDAAIPFWKWFYVIGGVTLRMPIDHAKAYALWTAAGRVGEQVNQNLGGDLQEYGQQGSFPIAGSLKDSLTANFQHTNPFGTTEEIISNPISAVPFGYSLASAATGRDVGTGRPLLNERGQNFSISNEGTQFDPPSDDPHSDITRYLVNQLLVGGPMVTKINNYLRGNRQSADTSIPLLSPQDKQPTKADFAALASDSPFHKAEGGGFFSPEELAIFAYNLLLPGNLKHTNLSGAELKNAVRVGKALGVHTKQNFKLAARRKEYKRMTGAHR